MTILSTLPRYILYIKLTGQNIRRDNPNWESFAKQYDFKIAKNTSSIATVEASPETIASFQKQHPEIEVTLEKKYHTAPSSS